MTLLMDVIIVATMAYSQEYAAVSAYRNQYIKGITAHEEKNPKGYYFYAQFYTYM